MNYIEYSLIAISAITACVHIYAFASLVGISIRIPISATGVKIYIITAGIKINKSIIKKKKEVAW